MKKSIRLFAVTLLIVLISSQIIYASDLKVMEIQNNSGSPSIFVRGIEGEVSSVEALVGNVQCPDVVVQYAARGDFSVDTLILIDNSLSIPEKSRDLVDEVISEILASRSVYERFSISTFGESIDMPIDFINDYTRLKGLLESIEYQNRETYLTDVLYDLIADGTFTDNEEGAYRRIFVVSDGVDNKSIGYTSDELTALLKNTGVPIYCLGVYDSKQSNNEQIKKMFAISRQTGGEGFLLSDIDNPLEIIDNLSLERNVIKFTLNPDAPLKDGSIKTVTINLNGSKEQTVTADNVRMPQEVIRDEVKPEKEETVKKPQKPKTEKMETRMSSDESGNIYEKWNLKVVIPLVFIAFILIVAAVVLISKKIKKDNTFVERSDFTLGLSEMDSDDGTELVTDMKQDSDRGATVLLMDDSARRYTLTLVDIENPARIFSVPIQGKVIVGRKRDETDICIDYDSSVSGRHCAIYRNGGRFILENLSKSNGTYLDDERINGETEIISGRVITMGRVKLKVEIS